MGSPKSEAFKLNDDDDNTVNGYRFRQAYPPLGSYNYTACNGSGPTV
jgi:hypothetical protein